jgi:HEAT repeat protein
MINPEDYLNELIGRICDRNDFTFAPGFDSTKTISWKATREAEKLDKQEYIPVLKKIIEGEADARKRDRAYFILGNIALNTSDPAVAGFFIQRIACEPDSEILASMLLKLKPLLKPKGTDIRPLLDLLTSENEEVRQAAIQALSHCEDKEAEEALVRIADEPAGRIDLLYALEALAISGSPRALACVQKHINDRDKEIRSAAAAAVSSIKARRK